MTEPANISHQPAPFQEANDKEFQHFIEMIKNNDLQSVRDFLSKFNNHILSRLELGFRQPPLYFAVTSLNDSNAQQMAKLLIQHGADPKYKDQNDQTVLFYACRDGKLACCKLLLQNGLKVEQQDMYGQTPLFYAASQNKLNLVDLFQNKDLINHSDKLAGQTALFYASRKGHTEMCRKLIEKGANSTHLDSQNKTAADYAKKARNNETADYLSQEIKRQREPILQSVEVSVSKEDSQAQRRKRKDLSPASNIPRATYKIVFMNEKGQTKDLTQQEVRNLIKNNNQLQTYLANPSSIPVQEFDRVERTQTWQKLASKLLQNVMKQKGAYWFLEPVDPVKYNIMDYFDIVAKPMDLGTIKKKLHHNVYKNLSHFVQDMNLIWNNCAKYNGQQHEISKTARQLQKFFIEEFKKIGLDREQA